MTSNVSKKLVDELVGLLKEGWTLVYAPSTVRSPRAYLRKGEPLGSAEYRDRPEIRRIRYDTFSFLLRHKLITQTKKGAHSWNASEYELTPGIE